MNSKHRQAFLTAIAEARAHMQARDYAAAMVQLERAHVLGQYFVGPHVLSHWLMFRVAVARRELGAAIGQLVRIALGAAGSAIGVVPTGNTGGSDVNMFAKMPIPDELARIMEGSDG